MARPRGNPKQKPEKPYRTFPLTAHPEGQWCKKIKGKIYYFGSWKDPDAALEEYRRQADYLQAGKEVPLQPGGCSVMEAANMFLESKHQRMLLGELSPRSHRNYQDALQSFCDAVGKHRQLKELGPIDFQQFLRKRLTGVSPHSLTRGVTAVRMMLKWLQDSGIIDQPIRTGPDFRRSSNTALRRHRQIQQQTYGLKMFTAAELQVLLRAAEQPLKAMILLGINGGLGNTDISDMPLSVMQNGWLDYPRPKTAIERRIPLWPETRQALSEVAAVRKEPTNDADKGLVFITQRGQRFTRLSANNKNIDGIALAFRRLLKKTDLKRPGLSFYALRHTFETVAGAAKDQVATSAIMGHADSTMAGLYRERIEDERLRDVTEYVRRWLFPDTTATEASNENEKANAE